MRQDYTDLGSGGGNTLIGLPHDLKGGYLAGMLQAPGFTPRPMAMEYAWYSNDGSGFALLDWFERWARNMGAFELVLHSYIDDRLGNVLARRHQFQRLGAAYSKVL